MKRKHESVQNGSSTPSKPKFGPIHPSSAKKFKRDSQVVKPSEEKKPSLVQDGKYVSVLDLSTTKNQPAVFDGETLLKNFLHPISIDEFKQKYWRKKPFCSKQAQPERVLNIIEEYAYGLDLEMMVENTASENVHVWMRDRKDGKIDSFKVDDNNIALICHRAGASLYFRGSPNMEKDFLSILNQELGLNFGGVYPDHQIKSEIETFISNKGHTTAWHCDFQENFTIQLQGSKKWFFKKSNLKYPLRGATPHYKNATNLEQQMKLAQEQQSQFTIFPDESFFADVEEIILQPGDILYHPAGVWHRVDCLEDSISINMSFVSSNFADVFSQTIKHLLLKKDEFRKGIDNIFSIQDARNQFSKLLDSLKQTINSLQVESMLPQAIVTPRQLVYDLISDEITEILDAKKKLKKNPLAILIHIPKSVKIVEEEENSDSENEGDCEDDSCGINCEMQKDESSEEESDDEADTDESKEEDLLSENETEKEGVDKFILHFNYGEGEEFESLMRIVFFVPDNLVPLFEHLKTYADNAAVDATQIVSKFSNQDLTSQQILSILFLMHYNGLLY